MAQGLMYFSTNWQWKNSLLRSSYNTGGRAHQTKIISA